LKRGIGRGGIFIDANMIFESLLKDSPRKREQKA
jgi:hypothetical protein